MENSDVMTTEDIDKLDSVIQLKPHQKTVEYTTVEKSEDNDLVSLDELYEKTGQENIEKILAGVESLLKYNKLTRDQGLLLKVQGAESWLELPDRMNAIKGGEWFISSFLNVFVDIIKSIIKFIKGICVWIYRRILSLFGFEKTKEEKAFLYRKEQETKKAVVTLYKKLGVDVDYGKLTEDLKNIKSTREEISTPKYDPAKKLISNIGKSNKRAKEIVSSMPAILKEIEEFKKVNALAVKDIEIAHVLYKKIAFEIRRGVALKNLTIADINTIKYRLADIAAKHLNYTPYVDIALKLLSRISEVDINVGIGLNDKMKALRAAVAEQYQKVKIVKYDVATYDELNKTAETYYKEKHEQYSAITYKKGLDKLAEMLSEKDADAIVVVAQHLNQPSLTSAYTAFCESLKGYASAIELTTKIVQQAEGTLQNVIDSHIKIDKAITGILVKDVNKLIDPQLNLSTEDVNELVGGDNPLFSFKSINSQFLQKYPDAKASKAFGTIVQAYAKSPEGKQVQNAARTFITSFQRKR